MTTPKDIPPDLLAQYHAFELTSTQLSELTGYHPVYLRRSIKRDHTSRKKKENSKRKLIEARELFRKSIASKSVTEIMRLANVSKATAKRIRAKYNV